MRELARAVEAQGDAALAARIRRAADAEEQTPTAQR